MATSFSLPELSEIITLSISFVIDTSFPDFVVLTTYPTSVDFSPNAPAHIFEAVETFM